MAPEATFVVVASPIFAPAVCHHSNRAPTVCPLSTSEIFARIVGVVVPTNGRAAPVAQGRPGSMERVFGTEGTELYSTTSDGLLRNFFQANVSVSLVARRPSVRSDQLFAAAVTTPAVTVKSTAPSGHEVL